MSVFPPTEGSPPQAAQLDLLSPDELVARLIDDQRIAAGAVATQVRALSAAVEAIAARLRDGGTLHYVGAGSSGRLGALDAAEMPPTFGVDPRTVRAHLAGGADAMVRAIEGAEDDRLAGERAMQAAVRAGDAVVGISAGGGAPFVVAAIEAAREIGAFTVALTSVAGSPLANAAQVAIVAQTGPELLAGSTRLKAGTAAKIALNTLSTAVMVRLGRVHGNAMVDVVATNAKLRRRALRLVCTLAEVEESEAAALLEHAGGRAKVAIVMARRNVDRVHAEGLLERTGGALRPLLS